MRSDVVRRFPQDGAREEDIAVLFNCSAEWIDSQLNDDVELQAEGLRDQLKSELLRSLLAGKEANDDLENKAKGWARRIARSKIKKYFKESKSKDKKKTIGRLSYIQINAYFRKRYSTFDQMIRGKFDSVIEPLVVLAKGYLKLPVAFALEEYVFNFWLANPWQDPKVKSQNFRRQLRDADRKIGGVNRKEKGLRAGDVSTIDAMEHVAIGAAVQTIDDRGYTRYYPDDWLAFLIEDKVEALPSLPQPEPLPLEAGTFSYLDWSQAISGTVSANFPIGIDLNVAPGQGKGIIQSLIKTELMSLVGEITTDRHGDRSAYFTESEVKPILTWLETAGDAAVAVDEDGLTAIVLRFREAEKNPSQVDQSAMTTQNEPEEPWTIERIDNVAIILAHLVRRALGDRVAGGVPYAEGLEEYRSEWREGYVVGALEVVPVPLEPLKAGAVGKSNASTAALARITLGYTKQIGKQRTSRSKIKNSGIQKEIQSIADRKVRSEATPEAFTSRKNALEALVGRLITKRDQILSITDKFKRDYLAEPAVIPLHRTLAIVIASLGGVFFGFVFSRTLYENGIDENSYVSIPISVIILSFIGLLWGRITYYLPLVKIYFDLTKKSILKILSKKKVEIDFSKIRKFDYISKYSDFKTRRYFGLRVLSILLMSFVVSLFVANYLASKPGGQLVFNVEDAFALSLVLLLITVVLAWRLTSHDERVQRILNLENLGPLQSRRSEELRLELQSKTTWTRRFLWASPFVLLACAIGLHIYSFTTDFLGHIDPDKLKGKHAQYDGVISSAAWVLPVVSLGILISIWNRFGESSAITMVHMVVHRRMRQIQGLMKAHGALVAKLLKRGEPFQLLGLPNMEAEAEAIEPQAELVKDHQDMARGIFLRRTAVVAAAVLAILQFDPFKKLEPKAEPDPKLPLAEKFLMSAFVDLLDGPLLGGGGSNVQRSSQLYTRQNGGASAPAGAIDVVALDDAGTVGRLFMQDSDSSQDGGESKNALLDNLLKTCPPPEPTDDGEVKLQDERSSCIAENFNRLFAYATTPRFDANDVKELLEHVGQISGYVRKMQDDVYALRTEVKEQAMLADALRDLQRSSGEQTIAQLRIEKLLKSDLPDKLSSHLSTQLYPTLPEQCGGELGRDKLIARVFYRFAESDFSSNGVACVATYGINGKMDARPSVQSALLPSNRKANPEDLPHECRIDQTKTKPFNEIFDQLSNKIRQRLLDVASKPGEKKQTSETAEASHFVLLAGFADNNGIPGTNIQISRERAENLEEKLKNKFDKDGFEGSLAAIGRGEEINAAFLQHRFSDYASHSRRVDVRICDFRGADKNP